MNTLPSGEKSLKMMNSQSKIIESQGISCGVVAEESQKSKFKSIKFSSDDRLSPNMEYDYLNSRIFCFSNKYQKIMVYSSKKGELLCRINIKRKVYNPILFIHLVGARHFLLVIGGACYTSEKNVVHGNKYIEMFELKKWEIVLNSRLIKLIIGRISPVVIPYNHKDKHFLLLLGGNSVAKIGENNAGIMAKLDYSFNKDINYSTNLTGVFLESHQIIDAFND